MKNPIKKIMIPFLVSATCIASVSAETVFYSQDFETVGPGSGYTTSTEYLVSESNAHFLRITDSSAVSTEYSDTDGNFYTGTKTNYFDGSHPFATPTVLTDSFSIAGETSLQFAIDLASNTSSPQWNTTSEVSFQYRIDSGAWIDIFAATDSDGTTGFSAPAVDGVSITNMFTTFSTNIDTLGGDQMEIRIVWTNLDANESLAIDNINIAVVSLPPAAFATLGLLVGMGAYRRSRR